MAGTARTMRRPRSNRRRDLGRARSEDTRMSKSIQNVKVFAAGTWNKQKFTEATLDGIVQAFKDANKAGRVPLKFGHGDTEAEQPFREGMPALGWVSKIWRAGADLMADFTDIPTAVFESIRQGLY